MLTLLAAIGVLVVSGLLFRAALPRQGKTRWFVGTAWEPYVVVILVPANVLSVGFMVFAIADLLHLI